MAKVAGIKMSETYNRLHYNVWFEVLIAYILDNVWFEVLIAYTLDNVIFTKAKYMTLGPKFFCCSKMAVTRRRKHLFQ